MNSHLSGGQPCPWRAMQTLHGSPYQKPKETYRWKAEIVLCSYSTLLKRWIKPCRNICYIITQQQHHLMFESLTWPWTRSPDRSTVIPQWGKCCSWRQRKKDPTPLFVKGVHELLQEKQYFPKHLQKKHEPHHCVCWVWHQHPNLLHQMNGKNSH